MLLSLMYALQLIMYIYIHEILQELTFTVVAGYLSPSKLVIVTTQNDIGM